METNIAGWKMDHESMIEDVFPTGKGNFPWNMLVYQRVLGGSSQLGSPLFPSHKKAIYKGNKPI